MNNDDFKEVPDNIQDNNEETTKMSATSAADRRAWQAR